MAKTIPQLTDATTVNAADELIVQQGGITKRATGAELAKGLNNINGTLNVKDFGAAGDGVTNDRAAIQAAIDAASAAGGATVFFPSGVYFITGNLLAKNKVTLHGVRGATEVRLQQGVFSEMVTNPLQTSGVAVEDFSLRDIIWNSNAAQTEAFAATAVNLTGAVRIYISGCVFKNATGYGLAFQAQFGGAFTGPQTDITIEDCVFDNNGKSGLPNVFDGLDFKGSARLVIRNCISTNNGNEGATIRGTDVTVDGWLAYGNGIHGLDILAGTSAGGIDNNASVNLSNIITYNNASRGVVVAISGGSANCFNSVNISNVHSWDNGLDGLLINEGISSFNNFEITISNALLRNNGSHGLNISVVNPKSCVVNNIIAKGSTFSGIANLANNAVFTGCVLTDNGWYGYDGSNVVTSGNQFIGGVLENNTLGAVRNSGSVNIFGVTNSNALRVSHLQNAVNFYQVEGRTSTGSPRISSQGTDTNIDWSMSTKGTGLYRFFRNNFSDEFLRLTGNGVSDSQVQSLGSATDVDCSLVPKGSGRVRYGTHAAVTTETLSGFITIKDAAGNTRKLAVVS